MSDYADQTVAGNQLGVTFHPELDDDTRLHELFLQM